MRRVLLIVLTLSAMKVGAAPEPMAQGRGHYMMGCVGCHGEAGVTISQKVPDLKDQVGFFLNMPAGRDYLIQLPNVAFYNKTDQQIADMLNYLVFDMGGNSAPKGAKPYTASEVGRVRKKPLTEVPLFQYRAQLVEQLIADYHAPESLRVYGMGLYDQ